MKCRGEAIRTEPTGCSNCSWTAHQMRTCISPRTITRPPWTDPQWQPCSAVLSRQPLTAALVTTLNPETSLADLAADLAETGYSAITQSNS